MYIWLYLTIPLFFNIWEVVLGLWNYGWFCFYFILIFLFALVWSDVILIIKNNFKARTFFVFNGRCSDCLYKISHSLNSPGQIFLDSLRLHRTAVAKVRLEFQIWPSAGLPACGDSRCLPWWSHLHSDNSLSFHPRTAPDMQQLHWNSLFLFFFFLVPLPVPVR